MKKNIFLAFKTLLFTFAALMFFYNCSDSGPNPPSLKNEFSQSASIFLNEHNYNIDLTAENALSSLPDSLFTNYDIIFTGESHGVHENVILEFQFLKHFNKNNNIKYLILEAGYSLTKMFNQYLNTGDENILNEIFSSFKGTMYWSKEKYWMWQQIYLLNQSLPEIDKIICVGVDVEHQFNAAIKYLDKNLPQQDPPTELQKIIAELKAINNSTIINSTRIETFANNFINEIENNHLLVEGYLGEKLFDFEIILNGLSKLFEWSNSKNITGSRDYNIRDRFMYDTFTKLHSILPSGKYYGHFGNSHIQQNELNDTKWFAARLANEGSPVKDKVLSITFLYKNCGSMTNVNGNYSINTNMISIPPQFDFFKNISLENVTFSPLVGSSSPFSDKEMLRYYQEESEFDYVITKYFQHTLLIQNGKATEPLK